MYIVSAFHCHLFHNASQQHLMGKFDEICARHSMEMIIFNTKITLRWIVGELEFFKNVVKEMETY